MKEGFRAHEGAGTVMYLSHSILPHHNSHHYSHGHSIDRMGLAGRWTMLTAADTQDAESSGRFRIGCKTFSII